MEFKAPIITNNNNPFSQTWISNNNCFTNG